MTDYQPENPNQRLPAHDFDEYSLSIIDILLILVRHIKVILITPAILCPLTIIYVLFFTSPEYISQSTFIFWDSKGAE